jgi:hypothetical protein
VTSFSASVADSSEISVREVAVRLERVASSSASMSNVTVGAFVFGMLLDSVEAGGSATEGSAERVSTRESVGCSRCR